MTTAELRADAARRRALASAAGGGEWARDCDHRVAVADAAVSGGGIAGCRNGAVATFIAANDPLAVLASCDRDELLADLIDVLALGPADLSVDWGEFEARFCALEAP